MNRMLLFLLSILFPVAAMRNPFECTVIETNNISLNCDAAITQDHLTLSSNSTWQITEQDEATMILKNQSGEIRQVYIPK